MTTERRLISQEMLNSRESGHSGRESYAMKGRDSHSFLIQESNQDSTIVNKIQHDALIRLTLEAEVKLDPRYSTLFLGLKLNHPHNVAILHPLSFLLRRVFFAVIIVFMPSQPLIGSLLLLLTCVGPQKIACPYYPQVRPYVKIKFLTCPEIHKS